MHSQDLIDDNEFHNEIRMLLCQSNLISLEEKKEMMLGTANK